MKDATATMGSILPDDVGGKDAVHVAVVAATAGAKLAPGQDVGLDPNAEPHTAVPGENSIGIVDPYLKGIVGVGQRFWLFLYPRTITGLNHIWTHPAFPEGGDGGVYAAPAAKLESERWLREYARGIYADYADMMLAARGCAEGGGDWLNFNTSEGGTLPASFWLHFERATGVKAPAEPPEYYSCSC